MNWINKTARAGLTWAGSLFKTHHGRIVLAGLCFGLVYFPLWLYDLVIRSISGSTGLVLISSAAVLAIAPLYQKRRWLRQNTAPEEDRIVGHLLILGGLALVPFFWPAMWAQALIWLFVLIGIVLSTWGSAFFAKYPLTTFLMPLTVYTRPGILAQGAWRFVMPPYVLENAMASVSTKVLQWIGQPATVEGRFVMMPSGAVEVAWRCNGFNMAVAMAVTGLLLGIFFKRTRSQIIRLMIVGAIAGLMFNVPRIMLMVMAHAYWGKWWFDFWHGSWGAQIFVAVLFTVYYYVAMAMLERQKRVSRQT